MPATVIAGWWFVRNVRLYGDFLGFNAFYAVLGTRDVPADLGQLWAERMAFASGYWGSFGGLNVPMPGWITTVLNWAAIVAAAGLVLRLGTWLLDTSEGTWVEKVWPFAWSNATAARALAWAFPVGVFLSWSRWATVTWSSQGRLIFTAISMWSLALVLGLTAWLPKRTGRIRRLPGIALAVALLGLCVVALPAWIAPAYRPPQTTAIAPADLGLTPLDVRFGDDLELLGYAVETSAVAPGQPVEVRLMWRALGPTPTYRSIFLHVLGQGDRIVAQRDTFPGHGLLPTTQLAAGRTWVERHVLAIPRTAYTPDVLTLAVGVYETATGIRTPPSGPSIAEGADSARFGDVALNATTGEAALGVRFGDGIVLEGYTLSDVVVAPGADLTVTLNWLCTAPVPDDYTVSVQVIDTQWHKAAQLDSWPLDGQAPTSSWQVGRRISETRVLTLSPDAVPGAYDLRISLYRPDGNGDLIHLPVSLGNAEMPSRDIVLTTVRVR